MRRMIGLGLVFFIFISTHAAAKEVASTVVSVTGQVEHAMLNSSNWIAAQVDDELAQGDQIQTREGKTTLLMSDESMLKLNRNTRLTMRSVSQSATWSRAAGLLGASPTALKSIYQLHSGETWIRNNNKGVDIEVETPTITASLRGTELNIQVISAELVNITVLEGRALAVNSSGSIEAVAGEVIIAALGQPPRKQVLLTPLDSVQWTVRIPNLLNPQDALVQSLSPGQTGTIELVFKNLSEQNITAAEQNFSSLKLANNDPLNVVQGFILMGDGDLRGAETEFKRLIAIDHQNIVAWRGLSITSLLLNDKTAAVEAAQNAVDQKSSANAVDWLLLGYAQRANFQLPLAEQSLLNSLAQDPNKLLSLINLSLLQFSDNRLEQAQTTINQALQIDPNDSLAHSMNGFISLTRRDHVQSEQEFSTAIRLDPQNSEAYLGLGLLLMRQNKPALAQKQINTAIALEPQRSLYLSYWAKMLHQNGRYQKALTVLNSASRLDPRDPTPHFYKSVIQRDLFLAGESIDSLERAIALNDNRAVYRSRLLLDQDLASRNINLATIYSALGMNMIATQKAIESSSEDFRNFSAHLFLSSVLSSSGRGFPAGSEILVSGLLLPANANSLSTINDYSTFFEGPEFDSNVSVSVGNQSSRSATFSLAGVLPDDNLSYGLVAATSRTDGWRGDNGESLDSFSSTVKWQANDRDSFLARISYGDQSLEGNRFNRFEIDQVPNANARSSLKDLILGLGYRRELSNRSDLLMNLQYRETQSNFIDVFLVDTFGPILANTDSETERNTLQFQSQYSSRINSHQVHIGAIYFSGDESLDFTQSSFLSDPFGAPIVIPELQPFLEEADAFENERRDSNFDLRFYSLYLDDTWFVSDKLSIQAGVYFEDFDNGTTNRSEFNPRLGLVWSPTETDTIRLVGFRYLLPQVQSRLQPTHTGGIFITRNTEEGALVEEVDLVWEHKWQRGFVSVNLFDLDRENREQLPGQAESISLSQLRGVSIGLNQQLGNRFGLVAGIGVSEQRDDFVLLQTNRDETNASIALNYVSPLGLTASLMQTYRKIDFIDSNRATESISITDLGLSYSFRDRRGAIGLTIANIFDQEFNWVTDTFTPGGRAPARSVVASASWNF